MINWINRQNNRHAAFFRRSYKIDMFDDNAQWMEPLLFMCSDKLNTRIKRISPRRSRKSIKRELDRHLERVEIAPEWTQALEEFFSK